MSSVLSLLRRLIWAYFFLWVFEGALRFWVLPGLSNALLLVRDPVVLLIYALALKAGVLKAHPLIVLSAVLAGVTFFLALTTGHGDLGVAVYGVRAAFLHLPLALVLPRVWRPEDMAQLARVILWLAVPMALLVVYQFQSPQGSWINQGGMNTHYGTVRPAGTFSFVAGMACFASLVAVFLAHAFTTRRLVGLAGKFAVTAALLVSVAVSGSRTVLLSVGSIFFMMCGLVVFRGRNAVALVMMIGVIGIALSTLSSTEVFAEGQEQLLRRLEDASKGEGLVGSVTGRMGNILTGSFYLLDDAEPLGRGIGMGTNVGARLLTGKVTFLLAEDEWSRLVLETGPVLGLLMIGLRVALAWMMLRASLRALRIGNVLPALLFGAGLFPVLFGQWGVPSIQGFAALVAGLCLAAAQPVRAPSASRRPHRAPPWNRAALSVRSEGVAS